MLRYLVIVSMFTLVVGALPSTVHPEDPIGSSEVEYYLLQGRLQVLDKAQKIAVIDGLTWDLIDDFSEKNVSGGLNLFNQSRTEFKPKPRAVMYYAILQAVAEPVTSSELLKRKVRPTRVNLDDKDIKEINEKGGKIYRIHIPPS